MNMYQKFRETLNSLSHLTVDVFIIEKDIWSELPVTKCIFLLT